MRSPVKRTRSNGLSPLLFQDAAGGDFVRAEENLVGRLQNRSLNAVFDLVEGNPVLGIGILDDPLVAGAGDPGVVSRDHGIVEDDIVFGGAADGNDLAPGGASRTRRGS